uniref:Uncharacterized protein n=1 Tax=Arundo donax TaxID=35708 RepID=A0A0A9ELL8_ARUDO
MKKHIVSAFVNVGVKRNTVNKRHVSIVWYRQKHVFRCP